MADRPQPGAPVERPALVGAVRVDLGLACVKRDSNPHARATRPRFGSHALLQLERVGRGIGRPGEHRHRTVTLTLFDGKRAVVTPRRVGD